MATCEAVIREGVETHIIIKLRTEPRWAYEGVESVNRFNNAIEGAVERRHPWFYWRTESAQLTSPLSSYGPWQEESSSRQSHILGPLAVTAGAALGLATVGYLIYREVKFCTSQPSSAPTTCSTIPNKAEPLTRIIASGTARVLPNSTNPTELQIAIDISKSSDVILNVLQQNNTSIQSMTRLVEDYIETQQKGWRWAIQSWIASLLSRK